MTDREIIIGWLVGMVVTAFSVGVICRHNEKDRSWSILIAPLWPAFLILAAILLLFVGMTEFGGWVGRKLPPHKHPQQQP